MEKETIAAGPSSNIENDMMELFLNSSQFTDPVQKHMPPIEMHETPLMHPAVGQQISGSEEPLNQQWRETGESSQTIAQQVTSPGEADSDMLEALWHLDKLPSDSIPEREASPETPGFPGPLEKILNPANLKTTFAEPSQKPLHYQDSPDDAGNILPNWTLPQIDTDFSMPQEISPLLAMLGHQIGALDEAFNPNSFLRDPESPEMLQLPAQRVASHPAPYHWMDAPELIQDVPTDGAGDISISQALSLRDNLEVNLSSLAMNASDLVGCPGKQGSLSPRSDAARRTERGTRIPSQAGDPRRPISGAYSTRPPSPTSGRGESWRSGR